jgi:hypothetical protein
MQAHDADGRSRPGKRTFLLIALALLVLAGLLAAAAMLPSEWTRPKPKPRRALQIELLTPGEPKGNPAIDPALAARVRAVARVVPLPVSDELITITLEAPQRHFATIVLQGGCLRFDAPGAPHVVLPPGTRLVADDKGSPAIVHADGSGANIGEQVWWEESSAALSRNGALGRLRAECGPGEPVYGGFMQSVVRSRERADDDAARRFSDTYGVPLKDARKRMRACRERIDLGPGGDPARMIENPCGMAPPALVQNPRSCPPGTTHRGGLCRTPEGFVRPIPSSGAVRPETEE